MLIKGYNIEEETMNSPIKYERDFLIEIGNQPITVFTVPESFLELAKEANSTSPNRHSSQPIDPPRNVLSPLSRGNSRGNLGGQMYGGHTNGNSNAGGFAFGFGLVVPPPPPTSRNQHVPKQIMETRKEILLVSDPNAWKPNKLKQRVPGGAGTPKPDEEPKSQEEIIIQTIVKETRGILNKLTPENFDRLMEKFGELSLDNQEGRISAVINVLFEKAIDEPAFSAAYAKMVYTICSSSEATSKLFRKLLLNKCQNEFQKCNTEEDKIKDIGTALSQATDEEKKAQLKLEIEDMRFKTRKRSLGNIRFIGELYKLHMLTPRIMVDCVRLLLATPDDENLECLCKLFTTVGQRLDEQLKELELQKKLPEDKMMDKFFATLDKLSVDKKISSRIRFGIMDLIELRQCSYKPRRQATGPKTIEEVHRDAYLQEIEEKQKIQNLPPLSPDGPGGSRGGFNSSQINHVPKKSDWTTVGGQTKAARFVRKPDQKPGSQFSSPTSQ